MTEQGDNLGLYFGFCTTERFKNHEEVNAFLKKLWLKLEEIEGLSGMSANLVDHDDNRVMASVPKDAEPFNREERDR